MHLLLPILIACGGDASTDTSVATTDTGIGTATGASTAPPDLPGYAQDCPVLEEGLNTLRIAGEERDVHIYLPANPEGAPVLFAWHYLGGEPVTFVDWFGIDDAARAEGAIVIAPKSRQIPGVEWDTYAGQGSDDLKVFDAMLTCAWENWQVDMDRVYSSGFSAGALWTVTLTQFRSKWLAAAAPVSGGATQNSWSPGNAIPMMVTWGGPTDTYFTFSFEDASNELLGQLDAGGHFAVRCVHDQGHLPPLTGIDYIWDFFNAHPKDVDPLPWADGLPGSMPSMCDIP